MEHGELEVALVLVCGSLCDGQGTHRAAHERTLVDV